MAVMVSVIQKLHDSEINGGMAWPVDGKLLVHLGCPMDRKYVAEALVESFSEAETWLHDAVMHHAPNSDYAVAARAARRPTPAGRSAVQRLYARGVAGAVMWVYDGAFSASLGDPSDAAPDVTSPAGLTSWADVEAWLRGQEVEGRPKPPRSRLGPT